jgi:PEP-CTERM motif
MKKTFLSFAAALALVSTAHAAPIIGTGSVAILGVSAAPASSIDVDTTFNFGVSLWAGGEADLAAVLLNSPLTTSPLTATVGAAAGFSASWGTFLGEVTNVQVLGPAANRTVSFYALGDFTPLAGAPDLSMFSQGPMSLTFSATQTGGPTGSISASYTIASPPAAVPEPVTLALVGLALAGAAAAARRRS